MRVVVLGSSGLLGQAATRALLDAGHTVVGVTRSGHSRPGQSGAAWSAQALDIVRAPTGEVEAVLRGADVVVHGLGPDDRERPPAPAARHFTDLLVRPTVRVALLARSLGVRRLIVLGSYFSTFHRREPGRRLTELHPYIAAREAQAQGAIDVAGSAMDVDVLEIPFVFGAMPGVTPMWKATLFDVLRAGPVAMVPSGRNAAVSATDVGAAVRMLVEARHTPGAAQHHRRPIATDNLSFPDIARVVLDELGDRRPVVALPRALLQGGLAAEKVRLARRGRESGLEPVALGRLLCADLSLDPRTAAEPLGLTARSVEPAIRETVRAAYPS
jgi:dihydroflavonol-4-reductase